MAVTVTIKHATVFGNKRIVVADITFDSSYPTSGEPLTATNLGLTNIELMLAAPDGGYVFEYDHTNHLLKAFWGSATASAVLAEVTNATSMSSIVSRIFAIGY